ncbi:MAG: glutaredoxin family protein [Candidatus Methylomirabilales bacterium]
MRQRRGADVIALTLYTKPDCCLCEEMKAVVGRVMREFPVRLTEIDITTDPTLEGRFGQEIPVLFINDRKAFKYRLTESELRRKLARAHDDSFPPAPDAERVRQGV